MRWMTLLTLLAACSESTEGLSPDTATVDSGSPGGLDTADPSDTGDTAGSSSWFADLDGDGFGSPDYRVEAPVAPEGYVANALDCDDLDATVYPLAPELCDGLDNDCDSEVDEEAPTWFFDGDGDGWGDDDDSLQQCETPREHVLVGGDCDDEDPEIHPEVSDGCDEIDQDCDGRVDEDAPIRFEDLDGDGYGLAGSGTATCERDGWSEFDTDCDDADPWIHPGASELCDGLDGDCDGTVDEDAIDQLLYHRDGDGDGQGDPDTATWACDAPGAEWTEDASDCDDTDPTTYATAEEFCDGIDHDCDGVIDDADASDAATWYQDADGDGHGDGSVSRKACSQPTGFVSNSDDCDDTSAAVRPGGSETCDGIDNDCDGLVDDDDPDSSGLGTWYADDDGDSYGDPLFDTRSCVQPSGYVADGTDCEDGIAAVNPGATEVCEGFDNDCDDAIDDEDSEVSGGTTWSRDADSDGYGSATDTFEACEGTTGYVTDASDCDDGDAAAHPGAAEVCDDVDNDCDGAIDESDWDLADATTWYRDADRDGYGDPDLALAWCEEPVGYVSNDQDCYDGSVFVYPGSTITSSASYGDGSYDYDCDGVETPVWEENYGICLLDLFTGFSLTREGWASGDAPECGESADWYDACSASGTPTSSFTRAQQCG